MPFKPGDPKPPNSGRKRGQKNRKKLVSVEEILHDLRVHPVRELLSLVTQMPPVDAARIYLELLKYCAPMLKAVEVPAGAPAEDPPNDDSETANLSDDKLVHLLKNNPAK